ncbi:MAG: sulfotransferase [Desulfobacteraceae bacterium]|nr:sulfotransferase [Desulfobacteraceae bacterium]
MKKPNLFVVGQPKAGTTALYYMLAQHPRIFMSPVKEPAFFCKDFIEESDLFHKQRHFYLEDWSRKQEAYLRLFAGVSNEEIIGECTTSYLYSKVAAAKIFKFNPHAKIIALLREPVDFLYSLHDHCTRVGFEDVQDLKISMSLENERKSGCNIPRMIKHPSALFYSERIKYCEQIVEYYNLFGKSNVKVIIYEDFNQNNGEVYREILEFLGVDSNFMPNFAEVNIPREPLFLQLNTWRWLIDSSLTKRIKNNIPHSLWSKMTMLTKKVFWKRHIREPLDPVFRKKLMIKYEHEVIKISELLGIDLVKRWKYDQIH